LTEDAPVTEEDLSAYFRNDIYHQAIQLTQTHEKFPHSYEASQGV